MPQMKGLKELTLPVRQLSNNKYGRLYIDSLHVCLIFLGKPNRSKTFPRSEGWTLQESF